MRCLMVMVAAVFALSGAALAQVGGGSAAPASMSIQDMVRIQGQGSTPLRGIGIVVGLRGTGDSGAELALARPLAAIYEANGVPLADLRELAKGKSAAIVAISAEVPASGGRADDRFDVSVSVLHSASSLEGGELFIAPLSGPLPGQGVYAMAVGPIVIEDPSVPTRGRIRRGATLIRDITMPAITDTLTLVVDPDLRGWTTTRTLAGEINGAAMRLDEEAPGEPIARAVDEMTVRVTVPEAERRDPANFIAKVMSMRFSPTLLDLPAQVVINERTGTITFTGDVEISPVAIAHKDLVVTTTTPPPVPTAADPLVQRENWVGMHTTGRASERARLSDLIEAFKLLDVPVQDQIHIITQIHSSGRLHGKLVVE